MKSLITRVGPGAIRFWWRHRFLDRVLARAVVARLRLHKRIWPLVVRFAEGSRRHQIRFNIDTLDGPEDRLVHLFDAVMKRVDRVRR